MSQIGVQIYIHVVAKAIKRKKNTKTLKEELVKLLRESDTVEQSGFDTKNTVDQQQAINKIKHYDNTIKPETRIL